jgi:hypothetical protein
MAGGEVLRGARSLDRSHRWLYLRIGLIFVPVIALAAVCSGLLLGSDNVHAFTGISAGRGVEYMLTTAIAILFAGVAFSLLAGAVAASLLEIDRGGRPTARGAYRTALDRIGSLAAIIGWVAVTIAGLTITVIGIPLALRKAVDWTFATPEAMIRGTGARDSLRASTQLVRGRWWRAAAFVAVLLGVGMVSGALVGVLLISATDLPLVAINVVASIVYMVVIPYCAIALTLERYSLSGHT